MKRLLTLALLLVAAALSGGVGHSQATFVSTSGHAAQTFGASAAFNGVAVSLSDPGSPLRATVALSATASSDRSLVSVSFQRSPAGAGTWTTVCAPTAAPYTCSWNSAGVADGLYDLRAVALDSSGYQRTSSVGSRRVDNTAPATSVTAATPLTGTVTVSATATDTGGSGVISVALEARPAGSSGAWTAVCTKASAPYSCSWNTTAVADGKWDVRSTATDAAGNTASSTTTDRVVDNTAPAVTVTDPGSVIGGTVALSSTTGDGDGSGVTKVDYQYRTSPSGTWTAACSTATAPFSCNWATPATGSYDLRAIATDGVSKTATSAVVSARQVDNTAPSSATISNPGSPLRGSVTLSGTGADAHSGLALMRFEYRLGAGAWTTACTSPAPAPYSCSWDTTAVADGTYDVRSVAVDNAGNSTSSAAVTGRIVDNTGPTVAVTSPGMFRGTTTVGATATDPRGVAGLAIQWSPAGADGWTTLCTDTSSPYSCSWNAGALADGSYDLRAIAQDNLGNQSTSATVSATVNNTGPTGTDVQGTNGGVNDKLDAGDTVVFTYSEAIAPGSILAGWSGTSTAIRVRVANNGAADAMEFYNAANTTPLNLLATGTTLSIEADYVTGATQFNATIARSGSTFVVTIGSLISGAVTTKARGKTPMSWQTNSAATSLANGKPVLPATVTESGAADIDF
jgi:chitinase